ncbi:MAG: caspase family protein [Myxococcales bacterium]
MIARARIFALGAAMMATLAFSAPSEAATRRLALVAGSNAGSGSRPALRYAESDAAKMARVLVEVGQVAQPDVILLLSPTLEELEKGFDTLQGAALRLRNGDDRILATFYFSGHSDGEALELGAQRFPISRLKARMAQVPADVRLTIVDACRSGAAVEAKGGQRAPAFDIRLADDLVSSGEVVLASSAANELALESPEVRGSYFTHYLVSGLRGAADASGDGQVTLGEAYRFAYNHTVAATSATLHDPQHPTYDFRLTGQGELVLAVLSEPTSSLEAPGRVRARAGARPRPRSGRRRSSERSAPAPGSPRWPIRGSRAQRRHVVVGAGAVECGRGAPNRMAAADGDACAGSCRARRHADDGLRPGHAVVGRSCPAPLVGRGDGHDQSGRSHRDGPTLLRRAPRHPARARRSGGGRRRLGRSGSAGSPRAAARAVGAGLADGPGIALRCARAGRWHRPAGRRRGCGARAAGLRGAHRLRGSGGDSGRLAAAAWRARAHGGSRSRAMGCWGATSREGSSPLSRLVQARSSRQFEPSRRGQASRPV